MIALVLATFLLLHQGQTTKADGLATDPSAVFEQFSDSAHFDLFYGLEVFEMIAKKQRLTRVAGGSTPITWSRWEGENSSGWVSVYAAFPSPFDAKQNLITLSYQPKTPPALSETIQRELLSKATTTEFRGGNFLKLTMPIIVTQPGQCTEENVFEVSVSGSLLFHKANFNCPISKQ